MNEIENENVISELKDLIIELELNIEANNLKIQGLKEYIIADAKIYYEEDRDYYKVKNKIFLLLKRNKVIQEEIDKLWTQIAGLQID